MSDNRVFTEEELKEMGTRTLDLVQEAIDRFMGQRTILVVAHRLSTVRRSDCIYVLEGGRIVESGTHKELMQKNGRFRKLHDIQFRT